jgi:hypothetical protein
MIWAKARASRQVPLRQQPAIDPVCFFHGDRFNAVAVPGFRRQLSCSRTCVCIELLTFIRERFSPGARGRTITKDRVKDY